MSLQRHINTTLENEDAHALPLDPDRAPGMKPDLAHTFHTTLQILGSYLQTGRIQKKHNMELCFALLIIINVSS